MQDTTIELRDRWIGPNGLTEDGRIGFTARGLSLVKQGGLNNGMGWTNWDDFRLTGSLMSNGRKYSPLGYAIYFLLFCLADTQKRWLWLWGDKGVGKTHLATIAGVLWIARQQRGAYLANWADWISKMQRRISHDTRYKPIPPELEDAHIQTLVDVPFLILDDVSTGHTVTTLWALDQLYVLLNGRIGKPTVITSNLAIWSYTKLLLHPPSKVNGERETYIDVAEKVADRLGTGPGGYVMREVQLKSKDGSYRQEVAE